MAEDVQVEASYLEDASGEAGVFTFSLPNATIALSLSKNTEGGQDAITLVSNLAGLWAQALKEVMEEVYG